MPCSTLAHYACCACTFVAFILIQAFGNLCVSQAASLPNTRQKKLRIPIRIRLYLHEFNVNSVSQAASLVADTFVR